MLASLSGSLALALGLAAMLLPLLSPELSRPRDAAWGAVLLLLGLVLITAADRLSGSPMLAVLCGGLLIGRLGGEVMQGRWRQLTPEEQQRLLSAERWQSSLGELTTTLSRSGGAISESLASLTAVLGLGRSRVRTGGTTKRWVRPEPEASDPAGTATPTPSPKSPEVAATTTAEAPGPAATATDQPAAEGTAVEAMPQSLTSAAARPELAETVAVEPTPETAAVVVTSFTEIEALIEAASGEAG